MTKQDQLKLEKVFGKRHLVKPEDKERRKNQNEKQIKKFIKFLKDHA